jgi:hypothetical protein
LTSADLGNFFFQPLDLHLQAADLRAEFLLIGGLVTGLGFLYQAI